MRCKNFTANNLSSKRRYNPYAFTEQVKNNKEKFIGFMFQLNNSEMDNLTGSKKSTSNDESNPSWSQIVTLNKSDIYDFLLYFLNFFQHFGIFASLINIGGIFYEKRPKRNIFSG